MALVEKPADATLAVAATGKVRWRRGWRCVADRTDDERTFLQTRLERASMFVGFPDAMLEVGDGGGGGGGAWTCDIGELNVRCRR